MGYKASMCLLFNSITTPTNQASWSPNDTEAQKCQVPLQQHQALPQLWDSWSSFTLAAAFLLLTLKSRVKQSYDLLSPCYGVGPRIK